MKNCLTVFCMLLSFYSCKKESSTDLPEVFVYFENDLKSTIKIESDQGFLSGTYLPGYGIGGNTINLFSDTLSESWIGDYIKIIFANGKTKVDRKCYFFSSEPNYYNLCITDTLSLFNKEMYTISLEGNDTIYTYKISTADSLEAH